MAAVDENMDVAEFSQRNRNVDIAAPGVDVLSTLPMDGCQICDRLGVVQYGIISGTSMSTPHCAGVAALLRAEFPDLPASDIADALLNSAMSLGPGERNNNYGNGLVQAVAALELLGAESKPNNPPENPPDNPPDDSPDNPPDNPPDSPPAIGNCGSKSLQVELSLRTDDKGSETYWWIMRDSDNYPVGLGTRLEGDTQYDYSDCLPVDCYTFSIFDGGDDGICCNFGDGSYSLSVDGAVLVDADDSDSGSFGSSISHSFGECSFPPESMCVEVSAVVRTDNFPGENRVVLVDESDGSSVWSVSFTERQTDYDFAACLDPEGCYTFRVEDSYSDGLCCDYGDGFATLTYDGDVVMNEGEFGGTLSVSIGNCP